MKKIIPLFIFLFSCVNTGSSIKDSPSIKNVQKDNSNNTTEKDFLQNMIEKVEENQSFVTEQGDVEDWKSNNSSVKDKVLEELKSFNQRIQEALEK